MTPRDPAVTARNRYIVKLSEKLSQLLPDVLRDTGLRNVLSLHGKIGGKNADFIDIKTAVIHSPDQFITLWLEGFRNRLKKANPDGAYYELFTMIQESAKLQEYLYIFLERTFFRYYESLVKNRPADNESVVWIGQNNASYGLLITPRFKGGQWENDGSEVRHFKPGYWTVGHVLESGLVVPSRNQVFTFRTVSEYLKFFTNVIVRNSGSKYELEFADVYAQFVEEASDPKKIKLLIPEYRYDGISAKHKYRLDFAILDQVRLKKIGIEFSPWSTHGQLTGTKGLTQQQINDAARENFEREMRKHKDYFRKFDITTLIFTDEDLEDIPTLFASVVEYLQPSVEVTQLNLHLYHEFFMTGIVQ